MKVDSPASFNWDAVLYVIKALGFKVVKREGKMVHLRKGSIHVIIKDKLGGVEILCHEDRKHGESHLVIEESKRLEKFKKGLLLAFKKWHRIEKLRDEQPEKAFDEARKPFYFCPYYAVCPSFSEDSYICTYRYSSQRYCDEYRKLESQKVI